VYGTPDNNTMTCHFYCLNTQLSRVSVWLSRDLIGEAGGNNLYVIGGNDVINKWDYLGMMARVIGTPCKPTGEEAWLDDHWNYVAFYPDDPSTAGSIGGSVYYSVSYKYTRRFKREYCCCGKNIIWSKGLKGISVSAPQEEIYVFQGSPNPWPPTHFISVNGFFMDAVGTVISFPSAPIETTKDIINGYSKSLTPADEEEGNVIREPFVPRRKCK